MEQEEKAWQCWEGREAAAQGKRVGDAEVGEGERRGLGVEEGGEYSGELPGEDHQE